MIFLILYIIVCWLLYTFQEEIIFNPEKLPADYRFHFSSSVRAEETWLEMEDGCKIHTIHFSTLQHKSDKVVVYIHGNNYNLSHWGKLAEQYIASGWNVWMYDYRGYGKSEGKIHSEKQLFLDSEQFFKVVLEKYELDNIVVNGYSIGTGMACYLASKYPFSGLILDAPYYNLAKVMQKEFPLIPTFLLKYKFRNNEYLQLSYMPVFLIHGEADELITARNSYKLKKDFMHRVHLYIIKKQAHAHLPFNPLHKKLLKQILEELL